MNSLQIGFLIFLLLPLILSPIVDFMTYKIKGAIYISWYEAIIPLYMLEMIISVLVATFVLLGAA